MKKQMILRIRISGVSRVNDIGDLNTIKSLFNSLRFIFLLKICLKNNKKFRMWVGGEGGETSCCRVFEGLLVADGTVFYIKIFTKYPLYAGSQPRSNYNSPSRKLVLYKKKESEWKDDLERVRMINIICVEENFYYLKIKGMTGSWGVNYLRTYRYIRI